MRLRRRAGAGRRSLRAAGRRARVTATLLAALLVAPVAGTAAQESMPSEPVDPVPALIQALGDRNPWVRRASVNALADIGDPRGRIPIRAMLSDSVDPVREAAMAALGLRERVRTGITLASEAGCAAAPTARFEELASELTHADARVRLSAARALGNLCASRTAGAPARAIEALAGGLKDESEQVREAAAYALGHLGGERAVDALIAHPLDPEDPVRQAVASALGELCDGRAVDPLLRMLFDPDEHVRQVAASGLGRWGDPGTAWGLIVALEDPNEHVRQAAADALGLMFAPPGIDVLDAQRCDA